MTEERKVVTADDLRKKVIELFSKLDPKNPSAASDIVRNLLQFMMENSAHMSDEANKLVDMTLETMAKGYREQLAKAPDSLEKRQFERQLRRLEGRCPTAAQLIAGLASDKTLKSDILAAGSRLFVPILQSIIDLLQDATATSHKGAAGFAKMALFFSCVNELAVAFHLAQRAFTNQTYGHIRTVFELCDKVDLFHQKPEEADKWTDGGKGKAWQEFSPATVREKLGKPRFDPIYGMFSQLGPHGTFDGIRLFTGKVVEKERADTKPSFHIWVGGCHREDHLIWTHGFLLIATFMVLFKIVEVYRRQLNPLDMEEALLGAAQAVIEFEKANLIPWAKASGGDPSDLEEWVEEQTEMCKKWDAARKADLAKYLGAGPA